MNRSAKQHLDKAKDYVAKGEEFYRKAAEEIIAAREADPTLTQREIGKAMGRSDHWISQILRSFPDGKAPFGGAAILERDNRTRTKRILHEAPPEQIAELVADLDVDKRMEISRALDRESLKRQQEREKIADEKFREKMGDETADGLELAQALTDTAWYLTKANQDLASFLKRANEIGVDDAPDRWRNRCLESIEWAEAKLEMAKALLQSDEIDWTAFEDMLGKEVN